MDNGMRADGEDVKDESDEGDSNDTYGLPVEVDYASIARDLTKVSSETNENDEGEEDDGRA